MTLVLTRYCILVSALLVLAGWALSFLNALGPTGYGMALFVIAGITWACARAAGWSIDIKRLSRWRVRRRHWLPTGFALIVLMVIVGGVIHAPNNFDSLAYRVPRVLHWLAEGHWHWIDTNYARLNTRSFVTEWTIAPILALTGSDRSIWLINFAMFLMLPGLIFTAFRGLGVGMRISWHWMWLIACADGVILQAAGAANDLPAIFYGVAAVALAISARKNSNAVDAWLSILSAALLTGLKPTNAPFGLLWLAVAWPTFKLLLPKPLFSALVVAASITVSFVPSAIINHLYCGDWTGAVVDLPEAKLERPAGLVFAVNSVALTSGNLVPSIFPWAPAWTDYWDTKLPEWLRIEVRKLFGSSSRLADLPQMPTEELGGFGFGLSWLAILSGITLLRRGPASGRTFADRLILISPWAGLFIVVAFMPATGTARYALAFYPFLLLPILCRLGAERVTRERWWRCLACFAIFNSALILVVSPVRPLWPAETFFIEWAIRPNPPALVLRARDVYRAYGQRSDVLAPVRDLLPKDARIVGLVSHNDMETPLWRPFGGREFSHVTIGMPAQKFESMKLDYLVANETLAEHWSKGWLDGLGMERVDSVLVKQLASTPPMKWTLFRRRGIATHQLSDYSQ